MRLVESEMSPKWRKNLASWMSGFACRWSMRLVLKVEARRMIPWTSYPFSSRSSARYEPSCPVMPVTNAFFIRILRANTLSVVYLVAWSRTIHTRASAAYILSRLHSFGSVAWRRLISRPILPQQ